MKYQPGDDIIILHTNEEGKVIEVINNKMLLVEVRGVRFPVYNDQVDFPYFKRFTKKKDTSVKKPVKKYIDDIPKEKKKAKTKREEGVWLSFIPKFTVDEFGDEVVELFKLYLINKNTLGYKFHYTQDFFGEAEFELKGEILMRHDFYLHDIAFGDFNDNPSFNFDFNLITPEKTKADRFEASVKLKPKQLFQHIEAMKEKNEPSMVFKLFDTYHEKVTEEKVD